MANVPVVKVKRLTPAAYLPKRMTEEAAGFDLAATKHEVFWINQITMVHTGLAMEIPKGYHGEIHIRSSLGKRGIRFANCTGIIDSDYRGEIIMPVINDSNLVQSIDAGDRIGQFILVKDPVFKLVEVDELGETERGEGGFGSTDNKDNVN